MTSTKDATIADKEATIMAWEVIGKEAILKLSKMAISTSDLLDDLLAEDSDPGDTGQWRAKKISQSGAKKLNSLQQ